MNRQAREHGAGRTEHSPDEPCPPGASRIGEVLDGKYRIVRELGRGGMGAVYEAEHAVIGRRFAVKFPHVELAQRGELLERFRREARVAGSLESEHLAAAVDFGAAADGSPYLVMEYLRGENLGELLARTGPLATARAASIVQQACRGLAVAHAHGVIHRDLKPENLFV
ncbi:MAG: serine/threonine protein kinase [Deltaproteobacteria bacterium]|nr:serine/threonine protein kinase [Deltaproteobacteria bacterium]